MTSPTGQSDQYKSVHQERMNGFIPGTALYTASRHQCKEVLADDKLQELLEKYRTYYGVDWEVPILQKYKQVAYFKSLLYPHDTQHRYVLLIEKQHESGH